MDLLLWRHAEAEQASPDLERRLTQKGEEQAKAMAQWILRHAPSDLKILVSPARRCQQTAEALEIPFSTCVPLGLSGLPADIVRLANWPDGDGAVLIVGHQPALGRTASLLLAGIESDWVIKKGGLWWLSSRRQDNGYQAYLRCALSAQFI